MIYELKIKRSKQFNFQSKLYTLHSIHEHEHIIAKKGYYNLHDIANCDGMMLKSMKM